MPERMKQTRGAYSNTGIYKEQGLGKKKRDREGLTQKRFPATALRTMPENTQRAMNLQWSLGICIFIECSTGILIREPGLRTNH